MLVETTQTGSLLRHRIVSVREDGDGGWRRAEETHLQRLHPASGVLEHFRGGFRARAVVGWDGERDVPATPPSSPGRPKCRTRGRPEHG